LPYRQLHGVLRKFSLYVSGLKSADYTTLWRRIRATEFEIEQSGSKNELKLKGAIVAIDATGMKVTNRGEWMREKWKKKRGWIKVHIAVDAETKELLSFEVTDERVGDSKEFKPLLDHAEKILNGRKIARLLCSHGYFVHDRWGVPLRYVYGHRAYQYSKISWEEFWSGLPPISHQYVVVSGREPSPPDGAIYLGDASIRVEAVDGHIISTESELKWNSGLGWFGSPEYHKGDLKFEVEVSNHTFVTQEYEIQVLVRKPDGTTCFREEKMRVGTHLDSTWGGDGKFGYNRVEIVFLPQDFLVGDGEHFVEVRLLDSDSHLLIDETQEIRLVAATSEFSWLGIELFSDIGICQADPPVTTDCYLYHVDIETDFYVYFHRYNVDTPSERWSFSFYADPHVSYGKQGGDTGKVRLDFRVDVFRGSDPATLLLSSEWMSTDSDGDGVFGDRSYYGGKTRYLFDPIFWELGENSYANLKFEVTFRYADLHYTTVSFYYPHQEITLECPADLHVFDFQGNHVGALYSESGDVIGKEIGIRGAAYNGSEEEPEIITLPLDTNYIISVLGRDEGEYLLGISKVNPDGTIFEKQVSHTILPGQSFWYSSNLVFLKRNEGFNEQGMSNWLVQLLAFHSIKMAESLREQAHQLLQEAAEKNLDVSKIQAAVEKADELLLDAKEQYLFGNYIAANILALEAIDLYQEALDILTDLLSSIFI
jgi:hypothetical protein